jgi:alpha/beta superfamily hydrolase
VAAAEAAGEASEDLELSITAVAARERPDSALDIVIKTTRGEIEGVLHVCEGEPAAAIYVGGALGGLDGPASGIYRRLSIELAGRTDGGGLTGLRLNYRQPGEFEECVLDTLAGVSFLRGVGAKSVVLIGHSFGGAVAIKAGGLSDAVRGVAALSSQLYGTRSVDRLDKPLLLVHGTADPVLDAAASKDIHQRAREPKRLVLYEGADHGLVSCAEKLFELLSAWMMETSVRA